EAYAVLSDKEKRGQYDRLGREAFSGSNPFAGGANPFGGFDFSQFTNRARRGGAGAGARGAGGFTDIFSDLFGGTFQQQPERGQDIEAETTIEFRDAVLGTTLELRLDNRGVKVKIPEGVRDGQKLRIRGKGGPGYEGGPAGDLNLLVHVRP